MIPDMQGPVTTAQTDSNPDELEFDPIPYLQLLWRQKVVVVVATLSCGVLAGGVTLLLPKVYEATARIYVGEPGSPVQKARIAKVRMIGTDSVVWSQVFGDSTLGLASQGVTLPNFGSAITIGEGSPANVFLVRVRLGNPDLASATAHALALQIVAVYRVQLAAALQAAEAARKTSLDFDVAKQLRQRRDAERLVLNHRRELIRVSAQIESGRAQLAAAKGVPEAIGQIRITLAGLVAQRDYLSRMIAESDSFATLKALVDDDVAQKRQEAAADAAEQRLVTEMGMAAVEVGPDGESRTPPAVVESSPPESRDASPSAVRNMGWALVVGLVLSILGVILRDHWTRVAAHA